MAVPRAGLSRPAGFPYTRGPFSTKFPAMSEKRRILTGITTSGTPHLGNYVGAIRPAIAASRREDAEYCGHKTHYSSQVGESQPWR